MRGAGQIIGALLAVGGLSAASWVAVGSHHAASPVSASAATTPTTAPRGLFSAVPTTRPEPVDSAVAPPTTTSAAPGAAAATCPSGTVQVQRPSAASPENKGYEVQYRFDIGVLNQSNTPVVVTPMTLEVGAASLPTLHLSLTPTGHSTLAPRELDTQTIIVPWTPAQGAMSGITVKVPPTVAWAPAAGVPASCPAPVLDMTAVTFGLA